LRRGDPGAVVTFEGDDATTGLPHHVVVLDLTP
jgi:hypothetical protein